MRPRLLFRRTTADRLALMATDTPRPTCRFCHGAGGWTWYRADPCDPSGEDGESYWHLCECWDDSRRWVLLPLPHRPRALRRRARDIGYSDEPPF